MFRAPNMRLDFGGIGKGLAVDAAFEILQHEFALRSFLIDFGGDLRAGDPPPGKDAWSIAVQTHNPERPDGLLQLANLAVATSGDLERFVEIDGVRYSHILDPGTGIGLEHPIAVTVIANDAITADVLATALSVVGIDGAKELLDRNQSIHARIVETRSNGLRITWTSDGFPALRSDDADDRDH